MARKPPRDDPHVRIYHYEMKSQAWRTLSPAARALLIEMRALFDVKRGDNRIFLSVRSMMERCNATQRAVTRARDELLDRGWIKVVEQGGFTRKVRHATVFALQNQPANTGNGSAPSKAYMRWQPREQKITVVDSATDR
ncbi:MAG: helix-turn-helix domain-containing protein [Xanthomonadales bacterium]|nr:helix-turn-helix domain-containing protein [Xanthomonadales bacterium]